MKNKTPNGKNWMSFLPDSVKINEISIPGTHDSCAYQVDSTIGAYLALTQAYTLEQQLEEGIRFLDIRGRQKDNAIDMFHGEVYLKQNLTEVLSTCYAFLDKNPSETILFSLKEENESEKSDETFFETIHNRYYKNNASYWYVDDKIPTLQEIRGKIVILRRFKLESNQIKIDAFGINLKTGWKDDATFSTKIAEVQDEYTVKYFIPFTDGIKNKKEAIYNLLEKCIKNNTPFPIKRPEKLFLNYCSGVFWNYNIISPPKDLAEKINPSVSEFYDKYKFIKQLNSVVIMDYPSIGNIHDIYWQTLYSHADIDAITIQILNTKEKEYFYSADYEPFDNSRREVFTWIPGNKIKNGSWILESVEGWSNRYYIYSTAHSEYLYAADYKPFDKLRRRVFTWRKGLEENTKFQWDIEFLDPEKTNCYIRNAYFGEYLYASSEYTFDKDRRRVFTWIPGDKDDMCLWEID